MRKIFVTGILFLVFIQFTVAQFKLGLKFSPTITSSRISLISDTLDIENDGSHLKFSIGLIGDIDISETYKFSTGIIYVPKTYGMVIAGENGGSYKNPRESYNLQYLQIPVSLKLFTNEILPDLAIFFQVGAGPEFKIFEEPVDEINTLIDGHKFFDTNVILGGGAEFRAGINTILFADLSYQRGLLNIADGTTPALSGDFTIRSTVVMIDLGVKF